MDSPRNHSSKSLFDDEEQSEGEDMDFQHTTQPSSSTLRVLARGNACLCCRRRKLKCDGRREFCGPCTRGRRISECIYEEVKVKTKTQLLQSRIRELEAKVKKLETRSSPPTSRSIRSASPSSIPQTLRVSPQASNKATFSDIARLPADSPDAILQAVRRPTLLSSHDSSSLFPFHDMESSLNITWSSDHMPSLDPPSMPISEDLWPLSSQMSSGFQSTSSQHLRSITTNEEISTMNAESWFNILPDITSDTMNPLPTLTSMSEITVFPSSMPTPTVSNHMVSKQAALSKSPLGSNSPKSQPISSTVSRSAGSWEEDMRLSMLERLGPVTEDNVPPPLAEELIRIFFEHRRQCFFEVHVDRFMKSLELQSSQKPHPALLNAMYLLACHFSPDISYSKYEHVFLTRTRKEISSSLENADRLLNFLQASCLLAWYFFFKGRLLEGHYHASAAARFAMSCGLHLLKVKADTVTGTLTFYCPASKSYDRCIIGKPEDTTALAERINLFWSIFLADRTGAIGTGLPVVLPEHEIETPWPRKFEDYQLNEIDHFDTRTLKSLYSAGTAGARVGPTDNLHAIKAKALALNERASRLASLLESDPQAVREEGFWKTFDSIDHAIIAFQESLPSVRSDRPASHEIASNHTGSAPSACRTSPQFYEEEPCYTDCGNESIISPSLVLAHTAAYGAVIQLHRMFSQNDAGSYQRCLGAARGAMTLIHEVEDLSPRFMPMMLGIVWTGVAEALTVEHERLKRLADHPQVAHLESELGVLLNVMKKLRTVFPILTLRINKIPIFQGCPLLLEPPGTSCSDRPHNCPQHPAQIASSDQ